MEKIKSIFAKITAFFLSIITALFGIATIPEQPKEEIKMATQREYCFDNDRLLIGAYNFYYNEETEKLITYAKDAGFDFFVSSNYEEYLDLCDEYGLGVITSNYNEFAPYIYRDNPDKYFAKWNQITQENYNYSHPCIWGDYILDEPHSSLFPAIGEAAKSYYANTTGKLPYINLLPMYATGEQLGNITEINDDLSQALGNIDSLNTSVDQYNMHIADFLENVDTDYICTDIYPLFRTVVDGTVTKRTYNGWLRNLDILSTACRETGRDLWVITQAAGKMGDDSPRYCDTPEDIRWQMYVTLAFGAKAVIHACYYGGWWDVESHMIDKEFNRTDTYYAVQQVNSELAAFADIYGDYIHRGAMIVNGTKAAGNLTNHITLDEDFRRPAKASSDPVLIGCFESETGEGTAYSIVNMYEPETGKAADISLCFRGTESITMYRKGVVEEIEGDTLKITLDNCEGVFVTVK